PAGGGAGCAGRGARPTRAEPRSGVLAHDCRLRPGFALRGSRPRSGRGLHRQAHGLALISQGPMSETGASTLEPVEVRHHRSRKVLAIDWSDGHKSEFALDYL